MMFFSYFLFLMDGEVYNYCKPIFSVQISEAKVDSAPDVDKVEFIVE